MLGGAKLKVCFTHERTCFAFISSKYSTNNDQSQCVHALWRDKRLLLWVVYHSGIADGTIAVNPTYSKLLGLQEGADLYVSPYADVKVLDELFVEPDSADDQGILEQNVELLQLRLLDQLRLVVANQKTVVWISPSIPIVFTPKQTGILVNHSRVVVKDDIFNFMAPHTKVKNEEKHTKFANLGLIHDGMLKPYLNVDQNIVLRAFPIDSDGAKSIHPYKIFIHDGVIEKQYKKGNRIFATIEVIPSVIVNDVTDEINDAEKLNLSQIYVEIVLIDNLVYKSLTRETFIENIPTCVIPKSLNNILNIDNGNKVILTVVNQDIALPEHITIYYNSEENADEVIDNFKKYVIESAKVGNVFVINKNVVLQQKTISKNEIKFSLKPERLTYAMLNSESFRQCTISARFTDNLKFSIKSNANIDYETKNFCRSLKSVEDLVSKIILYVEFERNREAVFKGISQVKGNILLTGLTGSGKSSMLQIIAKELTVYSHTVHCRSLKGRKDIPEILGKSILMCQERSPAVLLCDDVDALVPASSEGAAPTDIAYYQRLAVVIRNYLQNCKGVCVLMSAQSMKALHPVLSQFSGRPMYTAHFHIPELDQSERTELLRHLLNDRVRSEFFVDDDDVIKMAMDTSGSTVRDLVDYLNKRIFKAVKRKCANPDEGIPRLVEPVTQSSDQKSDFDIWHVVGGLPTVKQQLTESIFWPIMYPALFPSQSCGILLYGPPGTGKSFIGSCLAKLNNMNFISVKGPELLSKYIGQSEKAVRDIFDKADMKRPCILFFDEFDSLAPKRGHDSTGVTDRVVNQLLVRLDGAEGGTRGPVVAATSRPDLVDPALLRPGRLQTHVYCALPNQEERLEVLRVLAGSVSLSDEVDLVDLSKRTEGFSPADLKALLVTSQLTCLEKQLDGSEGKMLESVLVGVEDVESALAETKPSLSLEQRIYYDMIYKRFRGEKRTTEEVISSFKQEKQKVTLA